MLLTNIFSPIPQVQKILVVSSDEGSVDFWIWFRCLQGLVNRDQPTLYLIQKADPSGLIQPQILYEDHWLDYYRKTFSLPTEFLPGVDEVVERYKHLIQGYVLYDNEKVIQTQNLAITRCGLESLLPVSPDQEHWMQRHGISKRDDLCGKFKDNTETAQWAIDNLWPHCHQRLYANFCIHRPCWNALSHNLEDFIVYHKGFALDLPLSRQSRTTLHLYRKLLESAEVPGVQMNWHCARDQEKEYVAEAASKGFFTLCSVGTPNLTIHGGVGDPGAAYTQPLPPRETCHVEKDKAYVCFYVSDGDATWAMNNLHSGNWLDPQRGSFKLGWGILPFLVKLMPGVVRYYHETRSPNDCFWGPSSGAGYTYTHLWPEQLVEGYLAETRRLLDQTGQHGCNMVNWFLRDWWREVEDDQAVQREQTALASGPGLVCGLGGSPFARSYLEGAIPKLHSVHIANAGHDNLSDILRFLKESPERPAFLFLFAQIAEGVLGTLASEMEGFSSHPEIRILSMDEFFLTLQDAIEHGLVQEPLYAPNEALTETWLSAPGRHRLPLAARVAAELKRVSQETPEVRRRLLVEGAWIDLVSVEVEHVARDRESFLTRYRGLSPCSEDEEADTLFYILFTVAWLVIRAALEERGIYANHRTQCLEDFRRTCGRLIDSSVFDQVFMAWEDWEKSTPGMASLMVWCQEVEDAALILDFHLGANEAEAFTGWPPRTI